ncbi:hypothetical protein [Streptomyces sp. NBRC 110028]|uniref:hypothetical protein n=1 Tax=Streptomyces sp. NBRC 110028 TaxID=1621260 RepID=UPI0006E13DA8|nr:hypothetical protein [Streptomyces sp. NBRC 110028]
MNEHRVTAGSASVPGPRSVPLELPEGHASALLTDEVRRRYIQDILRMHSRLSYHRMAAELEKNDALLHRSAHGRGLVTIAAHTASIPERYLLGLAGFRLSGYLRAGYASEDVVFEQSLFCEPIREFHDADTHVITTDADSGRILGYVALAHGKDPEPRPLLAPDRRLFPCEEAHAMRLQTVLPDAAALNTHEIREVKRFVQAHDVTDRAQRLRITLELLAGITMAVHASGGSIKLLVGDVEEHVALRHLVLLGLDVHLLTGTTPALSRRDLMHPMYIAREKVLPFCAWTPELDEIAKRGKLLEQAVADASPIRALRGLMAELSGTVKHVEIPVEVAA